MFSLSILSRSERHKAVVGDGEVTYYTAAISTTGTVSWRFARRAEFTMPYHLMLDTVERIVNQPGIVPGR